MIVVSRWLRALAMDWEEVSQNQKPTFQGNITWAPPLTFFFYLFFFFSIPLIFSFITNAWYTGCTQRHILYTIQISEGTAYVYIFLSIYHFYIYSKSTDSEWAMVLFMMFIKLAHRTLIIICAPCASETKDNQTD